MIIFSTDAGKRLVRVAVSSTIVELVEERRKKWNLLQYLDGQHVSRLTVEYRAGIAALQAQVRESVKQRDFSLDSFARAMSELAASSKAPPAGSNLIPLAALESAPEAPAAIAAAAPVAPLVSYDVADQQKCTNCKTCYQEPPKLFEKTRIVVDGVSKEVARLIPGALERITVSPELISRVKRGACFTASYRCFGDRCA